MEEAFSVYVGGEEGEHSRHRVASMGYGCDVEQSLGFEFVVCRKGYFAVVFSHESSSCSVGDGVHGGNKHQGGVATVGAHLKLGVVVGCLVGVQPCCIEVAGIIEYAIEHRVTEFVLRCQLLGVSR